LHALVYVTAKEWVACHLAAAAQAMGQPCGLAGTGGAPAEQRDALAYSIYRGICTRLAAAVQRGIAVQILTFGLEQRFGVSPSLIEGP
jgi:hypothetical protein